MNNGYYFQILAGLGRKANRFSYPRILKEAIKAADLDAVDAITEAISSEMSNSDPADQNGPAYFAHLAELSMLFALYREDYDTFFSQKEMATSYLSGLGNHAELDVEGWSWYMSYLDRAALRLSRQISVEAFELDIDDIEWDELSDQFIYRVSGITGFVYLNEDESSKYNKSRFWLEKATRETDLAGGLVYYLNLAHYYLAEKNADNLSRVQALISRMEEQAKNEKDANLGRLFRSAVLELQSHAVIFEYGHFDDEMVQVEENIRSARERERRIDMDGKNVASFSRAFLKLAFARFYLDQRQEDLDQEDREDLLAMAQDSLNEALSISRRMRDEVLKRHIEVLSLEVTMEKPGKSSEKEIKDALAELRKGHNLPMMAKANDFLAGYYQHGGDPQKAFETHVDLIKRGMKRTDSGGYDLIVHGMSRIVGILNHEAQLPGVSWMVGELEEFFLQVSAVIDSILEHFDYMGTTLFEAFSDQFIDLEPASHFHAKVYLRYQYYEIKIMHIAAVIRQDRIGQRLAENLMAELKQDSNPLNFIHADWEEFKDVPNSVRNKMLNKCITITKGDLPAAADHLDFSYRNLRSYITFKEVNRLGFFLEVKDTNVRQMEEGIRLMFHDLYKQGTIFEVVFDMPKFLVEHTKSGFSSQDLEEALNIKGTTAKKYIKIMMEIGLIKLEKSVGRKHFYKLRKDNVMNRLGKSQEVLVS